MQIFENYSLDKILYNYEQGKRDEETCYLYEKIQQYKHETEEHIDSFYTQFQQSYPDANVKEFMVWVEEHVPDAMKGCLRNKYRGVPYDVLKKNPLSYKTISQIGIEVISRPETTRKNYMEQWMDIAEKMKAIQAPVFETHAHYNLENFHGFREELLDAIHADGIEKCIIPAIEAFKGGRDINRELISLYEKYDWIYYSFGSHPKHLWRDSEWDEQRWKNFDELLKHPKCIAVGEAGLDYSYPTFNINHQKMQEEFFVRFIELANKHQLPVILHMRSGTEHLDPDLNLDVNVDAWRILKEHPIKYGAVCHCFNGNVNAMRSYLQTGVKYFGIGGQILRGIEHLKEAVQEMPMESILLETDAPFINTIPGVYGPNTSYALLTIAEKIAEIKEENVEEILQITYANACRLFKVSDANVQK